MICSGIDAVTGEDVAVEFGETILSVQPGEPCGDVYLTPGFVDLQVNGFAGVDFNDPHTPVAEIGRALDVMFSTGVTRCLPTVITGSPGAMLACLRNLRRAQKELPQGGAIAGFHVEGPHIGSDDGPRGAHPAHWVRPPDLDEFHQWQEATDGNIRLVTLSPHWPEAPDYISALREAGVVTSIGHTGANAEQIARAVDTGATLSTHLGNAAYKMVPKFPNCLWDQLAEDRLHASFIVDGLHLDPSFLKVALRAKSVERTILVTDAAAPAGAIPGPYRLGELDVELKADDRVVLKGTEKLAGSALRMHVAIGNLMRIGGMSLRDAIRTATVNPARLIGLEGRTGGLTVGQRGDVVVFGPKTPAAGTAGGTVAIEAVYLDGVRVA
ncbi:MAG TPA: amidohydrolase family protein [Bryobacteraceae bacterium]|jgi:N-acetylglucosamine-6-phosphate deacetylase|nr:amidohydrolase family protein [Bryobacteraceae bacterium]